jgi:two-component system, cell cycle response regulator DivK
MKVLVVEDNAESLQLFIRILTYAGHEVIYTMSGLEGMKLARQERPEAILLDFNLPDIDGSQICLALRKQFKSTLMIAVTSQSDKATRKKAEMFGFNAFIPKPVNIEQLLGTLQQHSVVQQTV